MPATQRRRLGISRNEPAPQLLRTVNRQKTDGESPSPARNASAKVAPIGDKQQPDALQEDEDFINAMPLSSDDEDVDKNDIKPTDFKRKGDKCSSPKRSTEDDGFPPIRGTQVSDACSSPHIKSSSLRRSPRKGGESAGNTPKKARLETDLEPRANESSIFRGAIAGYGKKPKSTYSKHIKKQVPRGSQSNNESSPEAIFKKPPKGLLSVILFTKLCSPIHS
jgi:hypothetical protein